MDAFKVINIFSSPFIFSTKPVDAFLCIFNLFNTCVLFAHLHPVESPIKVPILKAKLYIVSRVHSTPFLVSFFLASLLSITTSSGVKYYVNSTSGADNEDTAMLIRAIVAAYTFVCTSIFVKLSNNMIKLSVDRVLDIEKEVARHDIVKFVPPSKVIMEAVVAPYKPFFTVESIGLLERIPDDGKHFFVSNHSLYGLEMPLLINSLYQKKNIFPRALADHFHFATPNGPILKALGAVDGTRDNVDALMQAGFDILVYPGGGHEVLKKSTVPRYELMWKERVGFARCAIKHGYPIVPCACVGTEDMFDSIADIPTGYRGMVIPISITTPCRVQKIYFWFGQPIPTTQYNGEYTNDDYAREVRDKTKQAIETGIKELQDRQRNDPERYLVNQYASMIRQYFYPADNTTTKDEEGVMQPNSNGDEINEVDSEENVQVKGEGKLKAN